MRLFHLCLFVGLFVNSILGDSAVSRPKRIRTETKLFYKLDGCLGTVKCQSQHLTKKQQIEYDTEYKILKEAIFSHDNKLLEETICNNAEKRRSCEITKRDRTKQTHRRYSLNNGQIQIFELNQNSLLKEMSIDFINPNTNEIYSTTLNGLQQRYSLVTKENSPDGNRTVKRYKYEENLSGFVLTYEKRQSPQKIEEIFYMGDGKISAKVVREDLLTGVRSTVHHGADGKVQAKNVARSDVEGRLRAFESFDGKGSLVEITNYEYENERLILEETRDANGQTKNRVAFRYDQDGNEIEQLAIGVERNELIVTKYTYY